MKLGIRALATYLPSVSEQHSLLGSIVPFSYGHLFEPAGTRSRPPTVARGATTVFSPPYEVSAAPITESTGDLASEAVRRVLALQTGASTQVRFVLHSQCTLHQNLLSSTCLRIEHDHFPEATRTATVGQMGTTGLPTALRLAALDLDDADDDAMACVTGADKWVAPFIRRVPGLVSYGDAAAACLVGKADNDGRDVAHVQCIQTSVQSLDFDLWTADAATQQAAMRSQLRALIQALLRRNGRRPTDDLWLLGDCGYGEDFDHSLTSDLDWPVDRVLRSDQPAHLSSASGLFSATHAVKAAVKQGRALDVIIWTASPAGHTSAMWMRCFANARCNDDGWSGNSHLTGRNHERTRATSYAIKRELL